MATATWASYLYPGTDVLVNKQGITDKAQLQVWERETTQYRMEELRQRPIDGDFSLQHMQAIHQRIFQDVYDWAGELRSVGLAKGAPGERTIFTPVEKFDQASEKLVRDLKSINHLRGMDKETFSTTMGGIYKSANDLHPFREGNGRTAREYLAQLAKGAGYELDYSAVSRDGWNLAAKESAKGNLWPIQDVFRQISEPERALAFDTKSKTFALARYPELDGAFKAVQEAKEQGKDVTAVRQAISKELHQGKIVQGNVSDAQSRAIIDNAAKARGLDVVLPDKPGVRLSGTVIAQTSHHTLIKVDDAHAIRLNRSAIDKRLEVGDKVTVQLKKLERQNQIETAPVREQAIARSGNSSRGV